MPLILASALAPVVTVTLNRPDKRNALNAELLEQLENTLADLERTPQVRVVILCGAGSVFCAGLDLGEAAKPPPNGSSLPAMERIAHVLQRLAEGPWVTIAAVQGAAVAGGAGLMAACDLAVAAEGTRIGFPETARGLVAALVMALLQRQMRGRDARELLLTGELVGAERAAAMGLVNRVVPAGRLEAETEALAGQVLAGAPQAVRETKRLFGSLWPRPLAEDFRAALKVHESLRSLPEAAEGLAAFKEKRNPLWRP